MSIIVLIFNYLIFVTIAVNLAIGLTILVRNYRSAVNKYFSIFVIFLSVWIISNFFENEPNIVGQDNLDLFLRLDFAFAILFFLSWFHFCIEFIHNIIPFKRKFRWLNIVSFSLGIGLSLLSLVSNRIITDISFDGVILFKEGQLLLPYFLLILFYSVAGLVILFRARSRLKKEKNIISYRQVNLMFWGYFLSISNLMVINFTQPFLPISIEVSRFGLYGLSVFSVISAYAIVKHRLFELKLFIVRAVSFLVLIGIIAVVYVGIIFFGTNYLFNVDIPSKIFWAFFVVTVLAMFSFQPLQRLIKKITDVVFFKDEYDSDKLLSKLTRIMAETIDLNDMVGQILRILKNDMKVDKASFAIVENHGITEVIGTGYEQLYGDRGVEGLFHQHFNSKPYVAFDELDEPNLRELLRYRDILFAMPLRVQTDEVAILVLGSKLSGESYNQKDIRALTLFGSEAGIAIQNAKAYRRIKQFSAELEKKVEDRTRELKDSQEKELAKAREVAQLKDEFVFIAAHELRTPVTAIRGFLELVSEAMSGFPKDVKQHLGSISEASEHLNQLINDLLQVSRSESGTMTISTTPVDIAPILSMLINEVSPTAEKRRIKINIQSDFTGIRVLADGKKLGEALMNLLSNAVKYNKDGGSIDLAVYNMGESTMIEVKDSGFGIPKEQKEKIFQKFFRAGAKGTEEVLGTGLGLFLTKMLVEKMGGKIEFSSVEGEGSTFGIILPRA